jgi:hypothetical protein
MIRVHRGCQRIDGIASPDVYFSPGYGRAASIESDGEWVLLEALGGAWQIPMIVRTLHDGSKDAISPYGYSGVYASPLLSSAQFHDAGAATVDCLQSLGVISVLLRHSPLVPQAPPFPRQRSIISGHPTRSLELTDNETAWSGMEGRCRTSIRKATKNGYTAGVRQATDYDLAPGGDFRRIYEETMKHREAASQYFFDSNYCKELLGGLGSNLLIAEVRDRVGVVVSATLLMLHAERLHYHLSGSNLGDARMGSNNLMLWTAIQFAIGHGVREFHLGGGVGALDNLYKFKRSLGGRELEYRVTGLIIDDELYQMNTQNRAKVCEVTPETLLASNFFPAYRAGIQQCLK